MKKIIFDFGCNEGQNLDYYLEKADYVIGVEANPELIPDLLKKFSKPISERRLFIENKALSNIEKTIDFFVSKQSNVLSQVSIPEIMNMIAFCSAISLCFFSLNCSSLLYP